MHITLVTKLGENIMTDFFLISGHFCASQDKDVSNSVVFLTDFRETKPRKNKKSNFRVVSKFW